MTVLSAQSIRKLCRDFHPPMVAPFHERTIIAGRSHGLSCASYDVRIAETILLLPFVGRLASTIERFDLPPNVRGQLLDKSSNARIFISAFNTNLEPGWRGFLTLELINLSWRPRLIRAGTPIGQVEFAWLDTATDRPYSGKYQDQPARPVPAIYER